MLGLDDNGHGAELVRVLKKGPIRVLLNHEGDAVPTWQARRDGIHYDIVLMRSDGWTLGAPSHLRQAAENILGTPPLITIEWDAEGMTISDRSGRVLKYPTTEHALKAILDEQIQYQRAMTKELRTSNKPFSAATLEQLRDRWRQ